MTPTVASGHGYCLQTAHLEPRCLGCFARNLASLPNCGEREGWQPHQLQPHHMLVSSRRLILQCWYTRCGSSQIFSNKPRLTAPFYLQRIYIHLVPGTVTRYLFRPSSHLTSSSKRRASLSQKSSWNSGVDVDTSPDPYMIGSIPCAGCHRRRCDIIASAASFFSRREPKTSAFDIVSSFKLGN